MEKNDIYDEGFTLLNSAAKCCANSGNIFFIFTKEYSEIPDPTASIVETRA